MLRYALRDLGLSTPTAAQLQRVLDEVIPARVDAQPLVSWRGASVRRYRNGLYLLPDELAEPANRAVWRTCQELGAGLGACRLERVLAQGLAGAAGARLSSSVSAEVVRKFAIRSITYAKTEEITSRRRRGSLDARPLPLLYAGDELVAVGDLWLAAMPSAEPGVAIRWIRPPVH